MTDPWDNEPNRIYWVHERTGLPCLIKRGPMGALCGYVGVPAGHPLHGAFYDHVDVNVHGGLTYSEACDGDPVDGICHLPAPGQPDDDVWWLGFDCARYRDVVPGLSHAGFSGLGDETYKDVAYVRQEVLNLACQLAANPEVLRASRARLEVERAGVPRTLEELNELARELGAE